MEEQVDQEDIPDLQGLKWTPRSYCGFSASRAQSLRCRAWKKMDHWLYLGPGSCSLDLMKLPGYKGVSSMGRRGLKRWAAECTLSGTCEKQMCFPPLRAAWMVVLSLRRGRELAFPTSGVSRAKAVTASHLKVTLGNEVLRKWSMLGHKEYYLGTLRVLDEVLFSQYYLSCFFQKSHFVETYFSRHSDRGV